MKAVITLQTQNALFLQIHQMKPEAALHSWMRMLSYRWHTLNWTNTLFPASVLFDSNNFFLHLCPSLKLWYDLNTKNTNIKYTNWKKHFLLKILLILLIINILTKPQNVLNVRGRFLLIQLGPNRIVQTISHRNYNTSAFYIDICHEGQYEISDWSWAGPCLYFFVSLLAFIFFACILWLSFLPCLINVLCKLHGSLLGCNKWQGLCRIGL